MQYSHWHRHTNTVRKRWIDGTRHSKNLQQLDIFILAGFQNGCTTFWKTILISTSIITRKEHCTGQFIYSFKLTFALFSWFNKRRTICNVNVLCAWLKITRKLCRCLSKSMWYFSYCVNVWEIDAESWNNLSLMLNVHEKSSWENFHFIRL